MKTDWTNQDVARLNYLIDKEGKAKGIKTFSHETGRSENSIRIKLSRISKERIVNDAENKAYQEAFEEEENAKTLSWFSRVVNWMNKIW